MKFTLPLLASMATFTCIDFALASDVVEDRPMETGATISRDDILEMFSQPLGFYLPYEFQVEKEKLPVLVLLQSGVTDNWDSRNIFVDGASLPLKTLWRILDAEFAPEDRALVIRAAKDQHGMTPERISLLKLLLAGLTDNDMSIFVVMKRLLTGVTDDSIACDSFEDDTLLKTLCLINSANFEPVHHAIAIQVVHDLQGITPGKITLLKRLLSDVIEEGDATDILQAGAHLSDDMLQLIIDADFAPERRELALVFAADFLTQDKIKLLKPFLQDERIGAYIKNVLVFFVPLIELSSFPLLAQHLVGISEDEGVAFLEAFIGKSEEALRTAGELPAVERFAYLNTHIRTEDWVFENLGKSPLVDIQVMIPEVVARRLVDGVHINERFEQLLESADRSTLARICFFIEEFYEQLGLSEEHDLVQNAIRKKIVLSEDITDPKNPWYIWCKMLERRAVATDFDAVTPQAHVFGGKNVRLNPNQIARFAQVFAIDEKSVPEVAPEFLNDAIANLEARLTPHLRAEIEGMQNPPVTFENLKNHILGYYGRSYLINLLNGRKTDLHSAKLMCVLKHLETFDGGDGTNEKLSSREARLVQILSNVRNCSTGQSADLEELYHRLPASHKYTIVSPLFDWENISHDQRQGYGFLMRTVAEGALQVVGEENAFMRRVCGLPKDGGESVSISELTHQTQYVVNFIGRDIGVNHPDSFPHNAGLFYEEMLAFEKEPLIKMYFDYIWQDGLFFEFFRAKINEAVKSPESSSAGKSFYSYLDSLRPFDMSPNQMWDVDEDTNEFRITDAGLVALLLKAGILQENTSALPWGSAWATSSHASMAATSSR